MSYSKVVRLAVAFFVAGVLLLPLLPTGRAPPLVPYEAWGLARNSSSSSIGLNQPIRTFIDGVDYSNFTSTYRADGSYQVQIAGNWYIGATSETPTLKEGGDPNDPVMFVHADMTTTGTVFQETAAWVTGGFQNLDLTEGLAGSQPALIKIQTVTTRPADTLSQYAYICNPTASVVDLSNYYFEKDVAGSFGGPRVALSGIVGAGQKIFGDFRSTSYLNSNGDALKLVFNTVPGGGAPNAGGDIVVDRVEFNASSAGALTWEPGNTIMTDSPAPGLGQEIHRVTACTDTNQGSDFTAGTETGRPTAPTVVVLSPDGGERWTGGTPHPITFNIADLQDPNTALVVNITYSTDSGATWGNLIVSGRPGTANPNSYTWNVPTGGADITTTRVLVCARDTTALLGCDASGNDFTIDNTFPSVTARDPSPGQTGVPLNQDVNVTFSEGMDQASVQSAFSLSGPNPGTLTFTWIGNMLRVSHANPLTQAQTYTVTITTLAKDLSDTGKNLIPAVTWSFTTFSNNPPSVSVTTPAGSECWSGGSAHNIVWTMSDIETPTNQLVVDISYTSGAGNAVIIAGQVGITSYAWTPSALTAADVQIVVRVTDGGGSFRNAQSPLFAVDSTPPTMTTTPANAATGVSKTAAIQIVFSEAMDRTSVQNGFQISPTVSNPVYSWNGPSTTLTVTHPDFLAATPYTVTLTGAHDACTPGLPLGSPTSFSFTTAANTLPTASVTAPAAGAQFAPGQSITITWTMSDTETPSAALVAYLNYTSGGQTHTVAGPLTGFSSGAGTYSWPAPGIDASDVVIVLTVIDADGGSRMAQSGAFSIKAGGGLDIVVIGGLLGIILAVVIIALLFFLVAKRRKKEQAAAPPPPVAPARAAPPRAAPPAARAPAPPAAPRGPPSGATKECPSCGTIIDMKDTECFMCGHKF